MISPDPRSSHRPSSSEVANMDEPLKQLSGDFLHLLVNGQSFSDVTFAVEGRHIYAHKCVLAARCKFFRMVFCSSECQESQAHSAEPQVIPVGIVGHDVFMMVLQFLYTGQLCLVPICKETSCWHSSCKAAVDFALQALHAAQVFGIEELSGLIQKELAMMAEKASIEDAMRILAVARKYDLFRLWSVCSRLIASSGLPSELLKKHLPAEMVAELEDIRQKISHVSEANSSNNFSEQRTRRMQKALDSSDVELVKLMVMEEGLDLDRALAVHYAVANCSRKVVKILLELGVANVNKTDADGRAPLHIAAELGDPDMIAVLLDHHADAQLRTPSGSTGLNITQNLVSSALAAEEELGPNGEYSRLRLCQDLLESAASMRTTADMPDGSQMPASILFEAFPAGVSKGFSPAWSEHDEVIDPAGLPQGQWPRSLAS